MLLGKRTPQYVGIHMTHDSIILLFLDGVHEKSVWALPKETKYLLWVRVRVIFDIREYNKSFTFQDHEACTRQRVYTRSKREDDD